MFMLNNIICTLNYTYIKYEKVFFFLSQNTYDRNIPVAKQQMWGYPIHITTFIQRLEFYLTIICEYSKLYEKQERRKKMF